VGARPDVGGRPAVDGPPATDRGLAFGIAAYLLWGVLPLYWKLLDALPAGEILAHRIIWSAVFCVVVLALTGRLRGLRGLPARQWRLLGVAALLISANWYVYIWAATHDHVVDASLGYFVNPLLTVVLGVAVRRERLRRLQWVAVAVASLGVALLVALTGQVPWVALVLASTFATYGLVKSSVRVAALEGLAIETLLMVVPAVAWLLVATPGTGLLPASPLLATLAVLAGPITAVPLLLFAGAARRLPLSTLGFLQYLAPTLQFLIGVFVFGETFGLGRVVGFGLIWVALATFLVDQARHRRPRQRAVAEPVG
jgi:chloramphenicol-sensitive protein RarD